MAYKYEIEQKAQQLRLRVLVAIYVLFVISAAIIGVSVRLQQIRNIQPSRPGADTGGQTGYTLASDPTYNPRNLSAFAYCAVVDANNNETGEFIPLGGTRFFFRQMGKRDVGQIRNEPLANLCSNLPAGCGLNGQTVAQCSSGLTSCPSSDGIAGIICPGGDEQRIAPANGLVVWPGQDTILGDLRWDDTDVEVTLDMNSGPIDQGEVTYNSTVYTINKSAAVINSPNFTPHLDSLLPIYRWQCQNLCTGGQCAQGGNTYQPAPCTFSGNQFNCPEYKYLTYQGAPFANDESDDSFLYRRYAAARDPANPTKVRVGFGYEGIVDSSYPTITNTDAASLVAFRGNLVKFRFTCLASAVTTPTPTPTPTPSDSPTPTPTPSGSVTPTPTPTPTEFLLTAQKTGPACVERVEPNNHATFTITVTNTGTGNATINRVEDSLPQGFTYQAGTTNVNGSNVPDTYVTTQMSGNSQLIRFERPSGDGGPWVLAPGASLIIRFTSIAGDDAITGTNTNQVVIVPEGHDAIDDIQFQFEVEQTCVPETGILDEPVFVIGASAVLILIGLYVMYNPRAAKFAEQWHSAMTDTKKRIDATAKSLERKANRRVRFEEKVSKELSGKRKKS
ncbi:MAG: hypothetical protein QY314_02710 [Candidatus Dojkabacteria bacterium]|nr:MAG: hypothetical protein QY314_02710 [Candidatus Dojkabacteria bacterium]